MYSIRGQQMFEYMSWYYSNSRIMQAVLDSQGMEIDDARKALEESLKQFYADTADWGLERWEKELALTPPADATPELRRALVKAKLLAAEIMTPERIEAIANCFVPSQAAKVIEVLSSYTFKVQTPFDDVVWIQEMRTALNAAKPAHLAMIVEYYAQFMDNYPELQTNYFLNVQLPGMVDVLPWKGRKFDGGWHYIAPVAYGGTWLLDGQQCHDGALPGNDDPIIPGRRYDAAWKLDGAQTFALANDTSKVAFNSEEAETVVLTPMVTQSDSHGVVLLFDGARRPLDGQQVFGAMGGAQDVNDVIVSAVLHQADEVELQEAAALQTSFLLRDNYPLPRLQYFSGAWAFGQAVTHDGSRLFNTGEKYDGLPGLPDPAARPNLLDGQQSFDGIFNLGAPMPVVIFGADADAADNVALNMQLVMNETITPSESLDVVAISALTDFAYADIRLDGSFQFSQAACFDGFWLQCGTQLYDGIPVMRADTLPEPEPLTGLFDGQHLFNGGAKAAYDGTFAFDAYPVNVDIKRFDGRQLQEESDIYPRLMLWDAIAQAARMDGVNGFDGTWNLAELSGPGEREEDEITIGRWFGGSWQFDAGNTIFFDGGWGLDGSYLHSLLGNCRNRFDGSVTMDGNTVFWKGGETFEHYRYTAS